jgi:predicted RND superfamily exporter protein
LRAFYAAVLRRRVLTCAFVLVAVGALAHPLAAPESWRIDFSLAALLVPDADAAQRLAMLRRDFGDDETTLALLVVAPPGESLATARTLALLAETTDHLRARADVDASRVLALPDLPSLDPAHFGARLRDGAPGERDALAATLASSKTYAGVLVSTDLRANLVVVPLAETALAPDRRAPLIAALEAEAKHLRSALPGARILVVGLPLIQSTYASLVARDLVRIVPLTLLVIALALALAFRRAIAVVAPLIGVGLATLATLGLIQATGTAFNIVNAISGVVIMVVGVAAGIHIVARYHEELDRGRERREAILTAMTRLTSACLVTSATTAVGLASLATAQLPVIRAFGLHLAAGVMLAFCVQMLVMPIALSFDRSPAPARPARAHPLLFARLAAFVARRAHALLALAILVGLVGAAGLPHVRADARALGEVPDDHALAHGGRAFEASLGGGFLGHSVVVEGRSDPARPCETDSDCVPDQTCPRLDLAVAATRTLELAITRLTGARDATLAPALRERLQARLAPPDDLLVDADSRPSTPSPIAHCTWSVVHPALFRAVADLAARASHAAPGLVATTASPADLIVDAGGAAALADDARTRELFGVLQGGAPEALAHLVTADHTKLRLILGTRDIGMSAWQALAPTLAADFARLTQTPALAGRYQVTITGTGTEAVAALTGVIDDLAASLATATLTIIVLMALFFRSLPLALLGLLPNLWSLVVVLGGMGLLDVPVRAPTALVFSVALGLAVDDTVRLVHRLREERTRHATLEGAMRAAILGTGRPITLTSSVLIGGFALNALADFGGIASFGTLSALILAIALFADLMLTPALILVSQRVIDRRARSSPGSAPRTTEC